MTGFHLSVRRDPVILTVGGVILALGAGIRTFLPPDAYGWSGPLTALMFLVGIVLEIVGIVSITRAGAVMLDTWDSSRIYRAMSRADPTTTISILQTSIPDVTKLMGEIEHQLIDDGKHFKLRVLLLHYETGAEVAKGRVRLRRETAADHLHEIKTNISELIAMKKRVDDAWAEPRDGATLKLEIRLYDFLPFGSHYQVGQDVIYSGLFWNTHSSVNGPMIRVTGTQSPIWKTFEHQFEEGWKHAVVHFPAGESAAVPYRAVTSESLEGPASI